MIDEYDHDDEVEALRKKLRAAESKNRPMANQLREAKKEIAELRDRVARRDIMLRQLMESYDENGANGQAKLAVAKRVIADLRDKIRATGLTDKTQS